MYTHIDSSSLHAQLICYLLRGCSDCHGMVVAVEVTLLERVCESGGVCTTVVKVTLLDRVCVCGGVCTAVGEEVTG